MDEPKVYRIGGRNYIMPPMTVGQAKLTGAVEIELTKRITEAYRTMIGADKLERNMLSVSLDASTLWMIPGIETFLATILTDEGKPFDKGRIAEYQAHFETVTREEFNPVFADFFLSGMKNGGGWMPLLTALMNGKETSDTA